MSKFDDKRAADYKSLDFYKKHAPEKENGFSKFTEGESHYFVYFIDGDIALISQTYTSDAGRDNGIKSVTKNMKMAARYQYHSHKDGRYYFYILAGNRQDVAASTWFKSEADAKEGGGYVSGAKRRAPKAAAKKVKSSTATKRKSTGNDDYRPLAFYKKHVSGKPAGIEKFKGEDGEFYFTYNENGKIVMLSEGYPTQAARDNGAKSVEKNCKNKDRYVYTKLKNGKHAFRLKSGNHQEIACSVWYGSAAAATAGAAYIIGTRKRAVAKPKKKPAAKKAVAAPKTTPKRIVDDYKADAFYTRQSKGKPDGIEKFKGDDGEYYFTYNENGKVAMVSEGYPTTGARDNGAKSVEKNRTIEKRYVYPNPVGGVHRFALKAGNHQEIARSVGFGSAAAALAGAAFVMGKKKRPAVKAKTAKPKAATKPKTKKPKSAAPKVAAAAAATGLAATAAKASAKPKTKTEREDDYLACKEYHGRKVTDAANNLAIFTHANGLEYFVMYDADGDVRLRSEGFTTRANLESELAGVLRLKDDEGAYKTITKSGREMHILYDETGREIARSCLRKIAPVAAAPAPVVAEPIAAAPVAAAVAAAPAATASSGGGFGFLKWLIPLLLLLALLLFGFKKCSGGAAKLEAAAAKAEQAAIDSAAAAKAEAAAKAAELKAATEAAAAEAAAKAKAAADALAAKAEEVVEAVPEIAIKPVVAEPVAPVMSTGLNRCGSSDIAIFSVPLGDEPKNVTRLGTFPEFGNSHDLSPSQFFDKLQRRYNSSAMDKAYLDYVFKSIGYSGGFADADASMISNDVLSLGTTGLLGFGEFHGYEYSTLNTSDYDRQAFRIQSANGSVVHFMKTCGNYFYGCR